MISKLLTLSIIALPCNSFTISNHARFGSKLEMSNSNEISTSRRQFASAAFTGLMIAFTGDAALAQGYGTLNIML